MATSSFFKRYVVKDDEAMENLIRAYEEREPAPVFEKDWYTEGVMFLEKWSKKKEMEQHVLNKEG